MAPQASATGPDDKSSPAPPRAPLAPAPEAEAHPINPRLDLVLAGAFVPDTLFNIERVPLVPNIANTSDPVSSDADTAQDVA